MINNNTSPQNNKTRKGWKGSRQRTEAEKTDWAGQQRPDVWRQGDEVVACQTLDTRVQQELDSLLVITANNGNNNGNGNNNNGNSNNNKNGLNNNNNSQQRL